MNAFSFDIDKNNTSNDLKNLELLSKLSLLKNKIKELSSMGVDCKNISSRIEKIDSELNEVVKKYKMVKENNWQDIWWPFKYHVDTNKNALSMIENELKEYDIYYNTYYACKRLDEYILNHFDEYSINKINNNEINKYELEEIVELSISTLNLLENVKRIPTIDNNKLFNKTCKNIYKIMKIEFKYKYSSKIFDEINKNDNIKTIMKSFINDEINHLDNSKKNSNYIKNIINFVSNSNSDLFDKNLLLYMSIDDSIIDDIINKYKEYDYSISSLKSKCFDIYKNIDEKNDVALDRKDVRNFCRAKALILSFLSSCIIFNLTNMFLSSTNKKYYTTTEKYCSLNDKYETKNKFLDYNGKENSVLLKVYEPYKNADDAFIRNTYTYNLSSKEDFDINNGLQFDLDKLDIEPNVISELKNRLSNDDKYAENYYEIIKITQDISRSILSPSYMLYSIGGITSIGLLFIFGLLGGFCSVNNISKTSLLIGDIKESINYNRLYKYSIEDIELLKENLLKLKKEIEENEELRNELKEKFSLLLSEEKSLKLEK